MAMSASVGTACLLMQAKEGRLHELLHTTDAILTELGAKVCVCLHLLLLLPAP